MLPQQPPAGQKAISKRAQGGTNTNPRRRRRFEVSSTGVCNESRSEPLHHDFQKRLAIVTNRCLHQDQIRTGPIDRVCPAGVVHAVTPLTEERSSALAEKEQPNTCQPKERAARAARWWPVIALSNRLAASNDEAGGPDGRLSCQKTEHQGPTDRRRARLPRLSTSQRVSLRI